MIDDLKCIFTNQISLKKMGDEIWCNTTALLVLNELNSSAWIMFMIFLLVDIIELINCRFIAAE